MQRASLYGDGCESGSDSEADAIVLVRDARVTDFSVRRGSAAGSAPFRRAALDRRESWGGGLRRAAQTETLRGRDDDMHGRAVPVAFARYTTPVIDLNEYQMAQIAAWRVAVPRALPPVRQQQLLWKIWQEGPAAAGYVRIGETLVPAALGPGSRSALSAMPGNAVIDS